MKAIEKQTLRRTITKNYNLLLILENEDGRVMNKVYNGITMQRLRILANEYDQTHKVLYIAATSVNAREVAK